MKEFLAKRKAHLIFGGGFLFVIALNIIIGFTSDQTFLGGSWRAISEIRPMEYIMFALFWYACALHRPKDEWESSLISLNLSQPNNPK
jgi:hypothetical protein